MSMKDYKKLVERLREEPKDSRKAVLSIYDLCIDAAYAIESLLDKLKYAEGERDVVTKRMIELEEQNAALRRHIDNLTDAHAVMVKEFMAKLEELERVKAELNWISVEDSLPERTMPPHDVLVYHDLNCGMYIDRAWYSHEKNKWRNVLGMNLKVTHWMPLPEPPEKEEKPHEKTDD